MSPLEQGLHRQNTEIVDIQSVAKTPQNTPFSAVETGQ